MASSVRFSTKPLYAVLLSPISATCPAYLILLDFITRIIRCMKLSSSLIVKKIQQDATTAFILRNGFTLHVSGDNSTHLQETCRVKPLRRINAIVASCWIYFTIKHDARNHKY